MRLFSIGKAVTELFRSWLNADRIRVSSSEGRLARLEEGQTFFLHDRMYRVRKREVQDDSADQRPEVILLVNSEDDHPAKLHIRFSNDTHRCSAELQSGGTTVPVDESEIVITDDDSARELRRD